MRALFGMSVCLAAGVAGCVKVGGDRPLVEVHESPRVDSRRVPPTSTHEEARQELERAYASLQELERDNAELEEELRECRRRVNRLEDAGERSRGRDD